MLCGGIEAVRGRRGSSWGRYARPTVHGRQVASDRVAVGYRAAFWSGGLDGDVLGVVQGQVRVVRMAVRKVVVVTGDDEGAPVGVEGVGEFGCGGEVEVAGGTPSGSPAQTCP